MMRSSHDIAKDGDGDDDVGIWAARMATKRARRMGMRKERCRSTEDVDYYHMDIVIMVMSSRDD
jgi:hypothetical protein